MDIIHINDGPNTRRGVLAQRLLEDASRVDQHIGAPGDGYPVLVRGKHALPNLGAVLVEGVLRE